MARHLEHALDQADRLGQVGTLMRCEGYERRDENRLDQYGINIRVVTKPNVQEAAKAIAAAVGAPVVMARVKNGACEANRTRRERHTVASARGTWVSDRTRVVQP